jgi:LasA protease
VPPPAGPFRITDGVNVRAGPGTSYPAVGTIELGFEVLVACAIEGEAVDGPSGPTNLWLRIAGGDLAGYVTSEYVATGAALADRSVIPLCTGI